MACQTAKKGIKTKRSDANLGFEATLWRVLSGNYQIRKADLNNLAVTGSSVPKADYNCDKKPLTVPGSEWDFAGVLSG